LKRGRSLEEENDDTKRVARNEERVTVVDEGLRHRTELLCHKLERGNLGSLETILNDKQNVTLNLTFNFQNSHMSSCQSLAR
jgi:hypothetical protein